MKRSAVFLLAAIPILSSCGGGSQSGVIPTSSNPVVPPDGNSAGVSSDAAHISEKSINDTLRGGITLGADALVYASGQNGLQVFSQSLTVQPAVAAAPPDTWPVVPKNLKPAGAVSASSTSVGALATLPSASPSPSADAVSTQNQTPALARFDTINKAWFDIDFGKRGDVWVDVVPDTHAGFFVAGDTPSRGGFTGFVTEVPIFCVLVNVAMPQPVGAMALGNDGFPWLASTDTVPGTNFKNSSVPSQIYHVGIDDNITQTITLPAGSRVAGMVEGPDGALWFTDSGLNSIGRVDPSGSVSFVELKSGKGLEPAEIAVGSDGALWFAETHGNKIGRITTSGVVTEFKTSANANPQGIVGCVNGVCATNAVFFTETHALGKAAF